MIQSFLKSVPDGILMINKRQASERSHAFYFARSRDIEQPAPA